MAIAKAAKLAKAAQYPKKPCPICNKLTDPRGLGAHMKKHKDPGVSTLNLGEDDVIMVPIPRSFIQKLVAEWLKQGMK